MFQIVVQDRGQPSSRSPGACRNLCVRELVFAHDLLEALEQGMLNLPLFGFCRRGVRQGRTPCDRCGVSEGEGESQGGSPRMPEAPQEADRDQVSSN